MIRSFLLFREVIVIENKSIILHAKTKLLFKLRVLLIRFQYFFNQELAQRSYEKLFTDLKQNIDKYIKVVTKK